MATRDNVARERRDTRSKRDPVIDSYVPTITKSPGFTFNMDWLKYFFYIGIVLLFIFGFAYVFKLPSFGALSLNWNTGEVSNVIVTPSLNTPRQYITTPIPATISTNFKSVLQYGYTVGFDVNISNPVPVQNMYRVIFYNGAQTMDAKMPSTDPTQINNVGTALSFIKDPKKSGIDATSLPSIQEALNLTSSNLCLYMAPDTNDIYLTYYVGHFADVTGGSRIENLNGWHISKPIKNVPINSPFRLTLAVDGQFIETYMNGELVLVTKTIIPGNSSNLHSYNSSYNYNFFGPPDSIYYAGTKIANLQYWGEILPPASIRVFSSAPGEASIFSSL